MALNIIKAGIRCMDKRKALFLAVILSTSQDGTSGDNSLMKTLIARQILLEIFLNVSRTEQLVIGTCSSQEPFSSNK